ncbi:hypothetical protein ASE36_11695 [Rhizobium sp. Root274]|uniref:DUF707 domain-containing protein n=1 Tax=unclassified Rhizobium TaxID=2613769 RepID=UPI0007141820|nr:MULTISPECIES: DUF707 domain-containing protein [unclassified Rhizobium]KQW29125.1 hypothetical protein ASC71_11715 [Rhizobium sp. Root1240]KRD29321.1 hypothetical protein ASE36_11695 [Rhizobium sp. Root274]
MKRRFLLVTRIGPKSLHDQWLDTQSEREFDVAICSYDPSITEIKGEGISFEYIPGKKVSGTSWFLENRRSIWENYDYVMLLDEDLSVDARSINKMFEISAGQNFKIAQPSLTPDSHFTFAALLQQSYWKWRHVNYIEMMCPIFRRDILETIAPLYRSGYESGIDLIWCNLVYESPRDFAVIDSVAVRHTEPVGGNKAANGFVEGKRYEDDIYAVLQTYQLPWLSCTPYSGVTKSGRERSSRLLFFVTALSVFWAVPLQRPWSGRFRAALVHLKHVALRPARNIKVAARAA